MPPSLGDEVSEAAGVARRGKRNSPDRLLLPLNAILDRVAAETQLAGGRIYRIQLRRHNNIEACL